ncbi:hypothetical protein L6R53_20250, partial [Myxococcota bacterium]|nr:hypothetical protein [Myxococcota bacterium]
MEALAFLIGLAAVAWTVLMPPVALLLALSARAELQRLRERVARLEAGAPAPRPEAAPRPEPAPR